jgi:hypothetical protein
MVALARHARANARANLLDADPSVVDQLCRAARSLVETRL